MRPSSEQTQARGEGKGGGEKLEGDNRYVRGNPVLIKIRVVASVARQKREVQFSKISWEERALDDSIQCLMVVVAYNHIVGICCASRLVEDIWVGSNSV